MTIVSRTNSTDAFSHRCLYCGTEWASTEPKPETCPKCSESRLPTSERIARMVRPNNAESSQRLKAQPDVKVEPDDE